jgi:two-component system chemotaxis response regulator CheY
VTKRVLNVGQCDPDHGSICRMLGRFDVEVVRIHDAAATLAALKNGGADLVLINRKLDQDYSDGAEIIRAMKAEPKTAGVPVMLVSNYPQYQEQAVSLGAEYGFGKDELNDARVHERLAKFLA